MIGVGIFAFEANGGIVIKVGIMREDRDIGRAGEQCREYLKDVGR